MRAIMFLSALGFVVMIAALAYGFVAGQGWSEVAELMHAPWFVVSLVDVYIGFAIVGVWMVYRERVAVACIWIALLLVLGNAIACLYIFLTAWRSHGDWLRFWLGQRAETNAGVAPDGFRAM